MEDQPAVEISEQEIEQPTDIVELTKPPEPTDTPLLPTDTPVPPTGTPIPSTPTPSGPGSITGTVDSSVLGGVSIMLAHINEIQSDGTLSVTLSSDFSLPSVTNDFAFEEVPPGQYTLFANNLLIGLVNSQGEMSLGTDPFSLVDYPETVTSSIDEFVFKDVEGEEGSSGFLHAGDDVVLFTVKGGQTLEIEIPIKVRK